MPHLTLHRLSEELAARGVRVSHDTVWLFLRREGLRLKTLLALEHASRRTGDNMVSCLVMIADEILVRCESDLELRVKESFHVKTESQLILRECF